MFNYSFWADEAYISGIAKQWITGEISLSQLFNALPYQKLYTLVITLFFKIFGISEFSSRLPSLITFIIGIVVIFILAKRLSNIYGGMLSTFLYCFSHLNLAYATQTKPYITLEVMLISILLLLTHIDKEKNRINLLLFHGGIFLLLVMASYLHTIGVLLWLIYFGYLIFHFKVLRKNKLFFKNKWIILILSIVILILWPIFSQYFKYKLLPYNNVYQVVKLFTYKYSLILIAAIFSYMWTFKNNKSISTGVLLYTSSVLVLATFQQYIFNIRYVLTIFGILFLYFGVFWAKVGERYDDKVKIEIPYLAKATKGKLNLKLSGKAIIPLVVLILLYTTGYKIARGPQAYYNPNIDKYGDVQIANYKDFYLKLRTKFPRYRKMYIVNNIFDVEAWYLGRYSNAYFTKFTDKPHKHHVVDAMVYGSLSDFKKIIAQHPQGLLIMEDWQSFLPDDVKEYAKKNLKLEFRIESLNEAPDDPWPLALYSWGL